MSLHLICPHTLSSSYLCLGPKVTTVHTPLLLKSLAWFPVTHRTNVNPVYGMYSPSQSSYSKSSHPPLALHAPATQTTYCSPNLPVLSYLCAFAHAATLLRAPTLHPCLTDPGHPSRLSSSTGSSMRLHHTPSLT